MGLMNIMVAEIPGTFPRQVRDTEYRWLPCPVTITYRQVSREQHEHPHCNQHQHFDIKKWQTKIF
jgi:hypothetical protein